MPPISATGAVAVQRLPLSLVDLRAEQPRRALRGRVVQDLARSIARHGVRQPITVRRAGQRYRVVAGERRCIAARMVGLEEIPAVVVDDDDAAQIESLVEAVHREDVSLAERAAAIRRVRSTLGLSTWDAVADRLGVSRGHLHRLLAISQLPADMRDDPRLASLTEKHVRALRRLDDRPVAQRTLWGRIHAEALSGQQALSVAAEVVEQRRDRNSEVQAARLSEAISQMMDALVGIHPSAVRTVRPELERLYVALGDLLEAA